MPHFISICTCDPCAFEPRLRTRSNFIHFQVRVQPILASPSSSLGFLIYLFTSLSFTKISFCEFKFEFRQINIQNRDNFFTAGAYAIKKIKMFCWCGRFKTISQLFSAIEIVCVVVTAEQQTIFCSDLLFLFNNLNVFLMNSDSFI